MKLPLWLAVGLSIILAPFALVRSQGHGHEPFRYARYTAQDIEKNPLNIEQISVATLTHKVYLPLTIGWPCVLSCPPIGVCIPEQRLLCAPFEVEVPPGSSISLIPGPMPALTPTPAPTADQKPRWQNERSTLSQPSRH